MKHKCSESAKKEGHAVKAMFVPDPHKHCLCHGHCGVCGKPAIECKLGKFHHVEAY